MIFFNGFLVGKEGGGYGNTGGGRRKGVGEMDGGLGLFLILLFLY